MSEYTVVELQLKDAECIQQTLAELGYQCEVGKDLKLYGYRGDRRAQTADIVVRRKHVGHAANDVGFSRNADGTFSMIISEFDRGLQLKQGQNFIGRFKSIYAKHTTVKALKKKGFRLRKTKVEKNGAIKLRLTRRG